MKERFCPCETAYVNMRYVKAVDVREAPEPVLTGGAAMTFAMRRTVVLYTCDGQSYTMTDEAAKRFLRGEDFCAEM